MTLRSLGNDNNITITEDTPLNEIYQLMAANGWDIKIEATLRGWGNSPGVSVWFQKWKWHDQLMGSPVTISNGTDDFSKMELMIRKTAEKALKAYDDFQSIPPVQLADGSLVETDICVLEEQMRKRDQIKAEMLRLKGLGIKNE